MASVARHLLKTNQKQPRAHYSKVFKGRSASRFARDDMFGVLSSACEIRYLLPLEDIHRIVPPGARKQMSLVAAGLRLLLSVPRIIRSTLARSTSTEADFPSISTDSTNRNLLFLRTRMPSISASGPDRTLTQSPVRRKG